MWHVIVLVYSLAKALHGSFIHEPDQTNKVYLTLRPDRTDKLNNETGLNWTILLYTLRIHECII